MIKIAICEPNRELAGRIEEYITEIQAYLPETVQLEAYSSGGDFAGALERNEAFQLVYLNLWLGDMDGVACARMLRERFGIRETLLICLSADPGIDPAILDLQPFLYLPIPFEKKSFTRKFLFAVETLAESDGLYFCKKGGTLYQFKKKDIILLESVGHEIALSLYGGEGLRYRGSLRQEQEKFPASFIRPHQSFLVNLDHVERYGRDSLTMCNQKYVPISELRIKEVKRDILRFLEYRNLQNQ